MIDDTLPERERALLNQDPGPWPKLQVLITHAARGCHVILLVMLASLSKHAWALPAGLRVVHNAPRAFAFKYNFSHKLT